MRSLWTSTTGMSATGQRICHHCDSAVRPASKLPLPSRSLPIVSSTCCVMTLLLNLLMSRTTSANAGDWFSQAGFKPGGTTPSRTLPVI